MTNNVPRLSEHTAKILERLALHPPEPGRRLRNSAVHNAARRAGILPGLLAHYLGELKRADLL
jgi:hypothetical protein